MKIRNHLLYALSRFLTPRLEAGRLLLLALSGGEDSLALLLLLLESRKFLDFQLHIAHVDHAYRLESRKEAEKLQSLAEHFKLPFHLKRLKPMQGSNLEDRFREERYQFFHELQDQFNFQAVLLAHHADDQAETVLKRLCEGARLGALGGLKPERNKGNLTLWRPLLSLRKEELRNYLMKQQADSFDDETNRDIKFLRSRMRLKIFPALEKHFGKQIAGNFVRFGSLFQEIASYLSEKRDAIEAHLVSGPFGSYLENPSSFHPLEMKFFLEEKARAAFAHLSKDSCEALLRLIQKKEGKGVIYSPPLTFVINHSHLFILNRPFPPFNQGKWNEAEGASSWHAFWKGFCLPTPEKAKIFTLNELDPFLRKKMKKWYASHQVPSFFHDKAPIFVRDGQVVGECLTGSHWNKNRKSSRI